MQETKSLDLTSEDRGRLWSQLHQIAEQYRKDVGELPTQTEISADQAQTLLQKFDFNEKVSPSDAINFIGRGLTKFRVHASHPRYFGLFNPASTMMGVAGDALAAIFNPQLATWNHASFPIAVESHLQQYRLQKSLIVAHCSSLVFDS